VTLATHGRDRSVRGSAAPFGYGGTMTDEHAQQMIALLTELRATQKESYERQSRLVWVAIPIFAVLCVQTVLLISR
jgi:hypothetical protein